MAEARSCWSGEQQRWLQAMGYNVWARRQQADAGAPDAPAAGARLRMRGRDGAGACLWALAEADLPLPGSPAQTLLLALAQAAGLLPGAEDPGEGEVDLILPPLHELAVDAGRRRRLWPALRALRRRMGGSERP